MALTSSRLNDSKDAFVDPPLSPDDPSYLLNKLMEAGDTEGARAELERLALEGLDSGPAVEVTPTFWADFRAELHRTAHRGDDRR